MIIKAIRSILEFPVAQRELQTAGGHVRARVRRVTQVITGYYNLTTWKVEKVRLVRKVKSWRMDNI